MKDGGRVLVDNLRSTRSSSSSTRERPQAHSERLTSAGGGGGGPGRTRRNVLLSTPADTARAPT
jgi:hypothetical protein